MIRKFEGLHSDKTTVATSDMGDVVFQKLPESLRTHHEGLPFELTADEFYEKDRVSKDQFLFLF